MDKPESTPVPVRLLNADTWESAHVDLVAFTEVRFEREGRQFPDRLRDSTIDRDAMRAMIQVFADDLQLIGSEWAGGLSIAWRMLTCCPALPETFHTVLPQLSWMMDHACFYSPSDAMAARERLDIWWRAATGEWQKCRDSIFEIAFMQTEFQIDGEPIDSPNNDKGEMPALPENAGKVQLPSVIVMHGNHTEGRGLSTAWKEMHDKSLQLIVARDVQRIRDTLHLEYPHAPQAINSMTLDLRERHPVRTQPMILVGPPGGGKSRLARRLGELLGLYVYRYDGAGALDSTFSGTPKAWSSAQPSAPARAVMASKTANPIVMVDEIEKAGTSTHNGNLWNAMVPFLERETASRYREAGLDAELDLSYVSYIATANSTTQLPEPLRDRFRIIKIPSPTLSHLPALAAQIMKDLAIADGSREYDEPLAKDELAIIGRAWVQEKFSMRKLQRMVAVTLEARDFCAMRH